jgi:hypothetical protein
MSDFSSDSENLQGPKSSNQRGERWRGRLKLLARVVLWLLSPLLGRVPEDDYGAKDLDGGGFQTLFSSDKDEKNVGGDQTEVAKRLRLLLSSCKIYL